MLVIGLGNPGPQYAMNRHNIGFMVVDVLQDHFGFDPFKRRNDALVSSGFIDLMPVTLLKPMTYMNCSGMSVQAYTHFYKVLTEDILVIHDDLDIAAGKIKIKQGGGSGGHNGLKSLDTHLDQNYWRLRLGIGRPNHKDGVHDYVLKNFSKIEQEWLIPMLQTIALETPLLIQKDMQRFLSNVALRAQD